MSEWTDFLGEVRKAEDELGGGSRELWYRGQANQDWDLVPSLMRESGWEEKEKELFREFGRVAPRLFSNRQNDRQLDDWQLLFDMQHYWVPTRLLDWTSVMGVALAFVLYDESSRGVSSALYILDPIALNVAGGRDEVIDVREDRSFRYREIYWEHKPVKVERPLAIRPAAQSERLAAQKGMFTVQGTPVDFESVDTSCYRKITLPSAAADDAREFLDWANLDEFTLYPDIVGMAHHIKRKILSGEKR